MNPTYKFQAIFMTSRTTLAAQIADAATALLHLNALYDHGSQLYLDAVIQVNLIRLFIRFSRRRLRTFVITFFGSMCW